MNKFITTLLATAILSLGSAAFAADATKAAEPAKVEATTAAPATEAAKPMKKHHHAKKVAKKAADAAAPAAK